MAPIAVPSHPVNIWVTNLTNPDKLNYLQSKGTFREYKRLPSLILIRTDPGKPGTRPPSCATPQQLTMYGNTNTGIKISNFLNF